jgi:hypothetical protein
MGGKGRPVLLDLAPLENLLTSILALRVICHLISSLFSVK